MKRLFQYCVVAILVVAGSSFSIHCAAQNSGKDGDEVTYRGNKFVLKSPEYKETMTITDPVTEKEVTKTYDAPPRPVTMNGKKIYEMSEVTSPATTDAPNILLEEYLLNNYTEKPWAKTMPDGILRIYVNDVVVDENGKVVYCDPIDIRYKGNDNQTRTMQGDLTIETLLANAPAMKPATLNGNKVIVRLHTTVPDYLIKVNNHIATYTKNTVSGGKNKF